MEDSEFNGDFPNVAIVKIRKPIRFPKPYRFNYKQNSKSLKQLEAIC